MRLSPIALIFTVTCVSAQSTALRINQIQVIGSHNSYHLGLAPSEARWLEMRNPESAATLDYHHPALELQFSRGVRQIEIDVFSDSKGGRYAHPANLKMVADAGLPPDPPFDPGNLFVKPGFKVIHAQDVDYRSNCQPFTGCLAVILNWSNAHPRHLPLFILIENKDGKPTRDYQVVPEEFTTAVFDALDKEIRSVLPPSKLITPDDVRGKHATLEEAVLTDGWPELESSRGKIVFLLDQRRSGPAYLAGHPSLKGRVIFTNAEPGEPDAAFVEVNDPLKDPERIPNLVRKGYIIRTRTDADLVQARAGDVKQRDAAFASGAQLLSSDFAFTERASWTGYSVNFPEGVIARCNPVLKPVNCDTNRLVAGEKEGVMSTHASGTFDVKVSPQGKDDVGDAAVLDRMSIDKQFHGDLEATSKGQMLAAGTDVKESGVYVALERVKGALRGLSGTFILHHTGIMTRGSPHLAISVVPDSGTGALTGLAGTMTINIVDGKHFYEFEYTLPAGK